MNSVISQPIKNIVVIVIVVWWCGRGVWWHGVVCGGMGGVWWFCGGVVVCGSGVVVWWCGGVVVVW